MRREVIDGQRWIAERLKFLRERLAGPLLPEERQAIEAEIEALSKEGGYHPRRAPKPSTPETPPPEGVGPKDTDAFTTGPCS
jgi:hypothetical protein